MLSVTINYDVEQYQESVIAGLNAKQTIAALLALAAGTGIVCLLNFGFGLPLDTSIYIAMPFCIPIVLPALGKQYGLSVWDRILHGCHGGRKKLIYQSAEAQNHTLVKKEKSVEGRKRLFTLRQIGAKS